MRSRPILQNPWVLADFWKLSKLVCEKGVNPADIKDWWYHCRDSIFVLEKKIHNPVMILHTALQPSPTFPYVPKHPSKRPELLAPTKQRHIPEDISPTIPLLSTSNLATPWNMYVLPENFMEIHSEALSVLSSLRERKSEFTLCIKEFRSEALGPRTFTVFVWSTYVVTPLWMGEFRLICSLVTGKTSNEPNNPLVKKKISASP